QAELDTILDHFGGSRTAYLTALARAKATPTLARMILADELRRRAVGATLHVAAPSSAALQQWYVTYGGTLARPVRAAEPVPWLGGLRTGIAVTGVAPGRLLSLDAGETVKVDGVQVTALGEAAPLGS